MITPVLPTYNRAPMAFVKGEGSWLTAEDGKRYLDLGAGIAVNALGHANPDLVAALTEQAGKLWHVSNLYRIPEQEKLAEALVDKTFADTVFFTNSGTEAAELALKMARKYHYEKGQPQRTQIITFEGAFHGRSTGAIAAAGSEKMVKGYGPLMPGFVQVKWADHDAFRAAITDQTCAVMIEPVQGEGGIVEPPAGYLKLARELATRHNVLLVCDEVQTGLGRTGDVLASWHEGVDADLVVLGKALGGGMVPVSAIAGREAVIGVFHPGDHGSTFGGNPLAAHIGRAALALLME
jgi:acetylornithine/N-succinyldiaminopimelate aminotransferase